MVNLNNDAWYLWGFIIILIIVAIVIMFLSTLIDLV